MVPRNLLYGILLICHSPQVLSLQKERINIRDLKVGQKLSGYVVEDFLEAKTGPKIFLECGVGRTNGDGQWRRVNGMLRLDRAKASVTKKRAARLRKKKQVELFVSRIQTGCGRLEVCQTIEDVERYQKAAPKVPISDFIPGQEVTGKVTKLLPYGAMIDFGANRQGLLHIKKVADIYSKYIDKEKGLIAAGLERGAKVRLVVESNTKRRVSLDFTIDVKAEAEKERKKKLSKQDNSSTQEQTSPNEMSADEVAAWEAYGLQTQPSAEGNNENEEDDEDSEEDDDYYDDEDDYDEETEIEDALGLGFY